MIICCGEALIDMIPVEQPTEVVCLMPTCGGAVFNTAIALGRLNTPVGFYSGLSTDLFGQQLTQELLNSRVDTSHIVYTDKPTTLAFVKFTKAQASYVFYDENTAGRSLNYEQLPVSLPAVKAYFFGGISLISEPCASTYEYLMKRESHKRAVIMLDPNIRPAFVQDELNFRLRLDRIFGYSDIIKVSDEDLQWIAGDKTENQAVAYLLEKGISIVIVTKGAQGACLYTAHHTITAEPAGDIQVVDTVGAGDTFNAGFLAWLSGHQYLDRHNLSLLSKEQLHSALNQGVHVSAQVVQKKGANPPWDFELALHC